MVSLAPISGLRSGRLYSSIGVGTVAMYTLQLFSSATSAVNFMPVAAASSSSLISSVTSRPSRNAEMRALLMSNPTTGRRLLNSTASGNPT